MHAVSAGMRILSLGLGLSLGGEPRPSRVAVGPVVAEDGFCRTLIKPNVSPIFPSVLHPRPKRMHTVPGVVETPRNQDPKERPTVRTLIIG